MLTSGLNGGGVVSIPDGITMLSTGFVPTLLAQFIVPTTGYIAVGATCGVNPTSTAPITSTITGGYAMYMAVNSTSINNSLFNGCQVPNGTNNGTPLGGYIGHNWVAVTAGDVVKVFGTILMQNPPSNYVTVSPPGGALQNSLNWHYVG
jgi:hypothetical protein